MYYVGWTTEPVRRLVEHNAADSGYTSRKRPWRLIGVEPQPTVAAAKAYERSLKRSPRKLARFKKRVLNRAANGRPCQGVG
jgi:putative endonuclease